MDHVLDMHEEYCEMGMTWAAGVTKKNITITYCLLLQHYYDFT